jgi:ABC-type uncharacterized transport system involved in gliding motility auxiliary subunit
VCECTCITWRTVYFQAIVFSGSHCYVRGCSTCEFPLTHSLTHSLSLSLCFSTTLPHFASCLLPPTSHRTTPHTLFRPLPPSTERSSKPASDTLPEAADQTASSVTAHENEPTQQSSDSMWRERRNTLTGATERPSVDAQLSATVCPVKSHVDMNKLRSSLVGVVSWLDHELRSLASHLRQTLFSSKVCSPVCCMHSSSCE